MYVPDGDNREFPAVDDLENEEYIYVVLTRFPPSFMVYHEGVFLVHSFIVYSRLIHITLLYFILLPSQC